MTNSADEQISFPTISPTACFEYNGLPIFSNAYPWLFPGGVGDLDHVNSNSHGYMPLWIKTLTLYFDGRFCKDPTFCFYALNYKQRHQNSTSGAFFINDFNHSSCKDLESLKAEISRGNYRFVEKLLHFSSKIRGSPSFWRSQRFKVLTWANRLVELGKLPSLFITLSCAEMFWEDLKRVLIDRYKFVPEQYRPKLESKSDLFTAIKEYSIVVQEFFIMKVEHWIKTFGKDIFKIEHYFIRFEFADGRGEIHGTSVVYFDYCSIITKPGSWFNGVYIIQLIS
jgi:hypothetical protein